MSSVWSLRVRDRWVLRKVDEKSFPTHNGYVFPADCPLVGLVVTFERKVLSSKNPKESQLKVEPAVEKPRLGAFRSIFWLPNWPVQKESFRGVSSIQLDFIKAARLP